MAAPNVTTSSVAELVQQPLPDLRHASRQTTRHALHRIRFIGILRPWASFKNDVWITHSREAWSGQILAASLAGNLITGSIHEERVYVSDERGVHGRIEGRAGTRIGAIFNAQNRDLRFGSWKGASPPYQGYLKTPDFVLMDSHASPKVIGEVKVPWIAEHRLAVLVQDALEGNSDNFRDALGQIAEYMREIGLKYAFFTTYAQTVFLRQVRVGRQWALEYSPVIYHDQRGGARDRVSFCQSLFHMGTLALQNASFEGPTLRNQRWTVRRDS